MLLLLLTLYNLHLQKAAVHNLFGKALISPVLHTHVILTKKYGVVEYTLIFKAVHCRY
jgi:hypothetical protein